MKFLYCWFVTVVLVVGVFSQSPSSDARNDDDEFIKGVVSSLDYTNILRNALERGDRGDGRQEVWMDDFKNLGIKQVSILIEFSWKNSVANRIAVKSIDYHPVYYRYNVKITDENVLKKIEARGVTPILIKEARKRATRFLENALKGERKAHGTVTVNFLDDGRLPTPFDADIFE